MITTGIHRDERGQSLVEFALVLPIVLLLLFGILQVALVLDARQTVAYAARVAADTYARTLDPASADAAAAEAGSQLRPQLRPPVASVRYAVTQEETQTCVQTQRRRFFGSSRCLQYAQMRTTSDRPATQGAPGKRGDLVVARVTYRYPSPIRAAFGPFRFPAEFAMTEEGVARIEVDTPAARSSAPASAAPLPVPTSTPVPVATPAPIQGPPTPPSTPTPPARCYSVSSSLLTYLPVQFDVLVDGTVASTIMGQNGYRWDLNPPIAGSRSVIRLRPETQHEFVVNAGVYGQKATFVRQTVTVPARGWAYSSPQNAFDPAYKLRTLGCFGWCFWYALDVKIDPTAC